MESKTLVAFASKHGATAEIAHKIGEVLTRAGLPTDVLPVDKVTAPGEYNNVIVGSAVYIGQWQKKAARFLKENARYLATKKVWLFSTGPTGEGDPVELMKGWKFPESLQAVADSIKPVDMKLFHGVLDDEKLNALEKITIKMVKAPMGDFRDWDAVERWAEDIVKSVK